MCVSDTKAVERLLFGPKEWSIRSPPGMIVVDSSTISPAATRNLPSELRAKGADYVDAPVTGSKIGGGSRDADLYRGRRGSHYRETEAVVRRHGERVFFRMGETGKGQAAKLAMNLQIALIYEGFAEALTLATKLGVDAGTLIPLIQASMVRSGVVDYKAPFVLKRDFSPNFPLRLMHKDIRLALDAAKEARVKLPGLETVEEVYDMATEDGHQDLDYAATLTLLEKWAEWKLKAKP